MADKKEIKFSIQDFRIEKFSSSQPKEKIRKDRIGFQVQHIFEIDDEKRLFQVGLKIHVVSGRQNPLELAFLETFTSYKIIGVEEEQMLNLPDHLVITFLSIAYSTTRGALAAKMQGTVAGEVPLPLINPTEVIKGTKRNAPPETEDSKS